MKTAALFFALAALGGLALGFLRLAESENPPTWIAVGHGLIATVALVSLIVAASRSALPTLGKAALAVFVVAAGAGVFLFVNYQETGRLLPIPLIAVHGALAVTGFGLLLLALSARRAHRS